MADRKPTVLNPAGYQENLQDTDNLIVEAAPTTDNHAVNKGYADTEIAEAGKWQVTGEFLEPKDGDLQVKVGSFDYSDATSKGTVISNLGGVDIKIATGNTQDALTTWLGNDSKIQLKFDGGAAFPGNVGIGTNAPTENLSIFGADPVLLIQDSETGLAAANSTVRFAESGPGGSLDNYWDVGPKPLTNNNFAFSIGGATSYFNIRFDNGDVGIGTDSPISKLHVEGSGDATSTNVVPSEYTANIQTDTAFLNIGSANGIPCLQGSGTGTGYYLLLNPFNGNVGIGTDSPQGKLHVGSQVSFLDSGANSIISNSGNHQRLVIAAGNTHVSDIQFRKASGTKNSGIIRYDAYQDMRFYTDGTEKVRIEAAGNVGIGTDSPINNLHVKGSSARDSGIALHTTSNNADDGPLISFSRGTSATKEGTIGNIRGGREGSGGYLAFSTRNPDATQVDEHLRITNDGNVGIGTDSPETELHVSSPQPPKLTLERSGDSNPAKWSISAGDNKLLFKDEAANQERMRIDANGNVGIGTDSPEAELHVNGTIKADDFNVGGITKDSYLRSDADDSASGELTFNGKVNIRGNLDISDSQNLWFGSNDDVEIYYNGTDNWLYCDFQTGNGLIFQDNGSNTMVLEDSGVFRPTTTNTGAIGSSSYYWNQGHFFNFTANGTIFAKGAIDLTDNVKIKFGTGDDTEMYYNGSNTYIDLKTEGNFYIRDGTTSRFFVTKAGNATLSGKLTAGNFDLESLPALP